jgi:4a-hydroxytetrahydrobiopterin dehydratase
MAPLTPEETRVYLEDIPAWALDTEKRQISREFVFSDFVSAINFVNDIAHLAEEEGHHPDMRISFNKVLCELSTHAIKGLSENDFIMAAKIDELFQSFAALENE